MNGQGSIPDLSMSLPPGRSILTVMPSIIEQAVFALPGSLPGWVRMGTDGYGWVRMGTESSSRGFVVYFHIANFKQYFFIDSGNI